MLNAEQIQANKMKYLELMSTLGIDMTPVCKYLDEVDYFTKPVSSTNFRSYEGGLCRYALDLYKMLQQLADAFFAGMYSKETLIKVSLFRDIYRAEMYEAYNKNVKDDTTGNWSSAKAYKVSENRRVFGDINFSSYMVAKNFVELSDEEIEAIVMSRASETAPDAREVQRAYKLVTLVMLADKAISNFIPEK